MSNSSSLYAQLILKQAFGPTATIATRLMRTKGPVMLLEILKDCSDVCALRMTRCLRSLIRHMVVVTKQSTCCKYDLNYTNIFTISRFPFLCQLVMHFYGHLAEELVRCLFLIGQAGVSDLLRCCLTLRSASTNDEQLHALVDSLVNSFDSLMRTGVLTFDKYPCDLSEVSEKNSINNQPPDPAEWPLPKEFLAEHLHKLVSSGSLRLDDAEESSGEPEAKKARIHPLPEIVSTLTIRPNISTMEAMWRDRLIVQLAEERLGQSCGDILSRMLCIAAAGRRNTEVTSFESGGVSRNELIRSLREQNEHFNSYVSLLTEDAVEFLVQEPGIGSYSYKCPYKRIITAMLTKHAEHVVQVLFDYSGMRIFRLLICCGPLTHEEIERRILLPQKDFRRTLPKMIAAGFISTTELSKSKEYTSETILCLYSVNLRRVAMLLIDMAQHTALRVATRAEHEFSQKIWLVGRRYRVESLIHVHQSKLSELTKGGGEHQPTTESDEQTSLLEQQKESLQALISSVTPSEQQQLDTLASKLSKLTSCEHEAHTTWFVADLFLRLQSV